MQGAGGDIVLIEGAELFLVFPELELEPLELGHIPVGPAVADENIGIVEYGESVGQHGTNLLILAHDAAAGVLQRFVPLHDARDRPQFVAVFLRAKIIGTALSHQLIGLVSVDIESRRAHVGESPLRIDFPDHLAALPGDLHEASLAFGTGLHGPREPAVGAKQIGAHPRRREREDPRDDDILFELIESVAERHPSGLVVGGYAQVLKARMHVLVSLRESPSGGVGGLGGWTIGRHPHESRSRLFGEGPRNVVQCDEGPFGIEPRGDLVREGRRGLPAGNDPEIIDVDGAGGDEAFEDVGAHTPGICLAPGHGFDDRIVRAPEGKAGEVMPDIQAGLLQLAPDRVPAPEGLLVDGHQRFASQILGAADVVPVSPAEEHAAEDRHGMVAVSIL